jgi:hypothetical protein
MISLGWGIAHLWFSNADMCTLKGVMPTPDRRPSIHVVRPYESDEGSDTDLIPVFAVVWVASVVRVIGGLAVDEVFGTEPTLALLMMIVLPLLLKTHHRRQA